MSECCQCEDCVRFREASRPFQERDWHIMRGTILQKDAELDRLREVQISCHRDIIRLSDELDCLRADHEWLGKRTENLNAEIAHLHAENEELKRQENSKDWLALVAGCKRLRAENVAMHNLIANMTQPEIAQEVIRLHADHERLLVNFEEEAKIRRNTELVRNRFASRISELEDTENRQLAELDRLRAELATAHKFMEEDADNYQSLKEERDRLRAENERLTIALEQIRDMWPWDGMAIRELVKDTLRQQLMNESPSATRNSGEKPE